MKKQRIKPVVGWAGIRNGRLHLSAFDCEDLGQSPHAWFVLRHKDVAKKFYKELVRVEVRIVKPKPRRKAKGRKS